MRLLSQIAALCLAAVATPLCARPFTVDDLLAAEDFGQAAFTPDGKRLVFERLAAHADAGPFDYDAYPPFRRGRLHVAEIGSPARPLLQPGPQEGHTAGPISPDGRRLAVFRLQGRTWDLGVVELDTGKARWLGVTPELGQLGRTVAWRNDHQLVVAARADLPPRLRGGWAARARLQELWARAADGDQAALVRRDSGRFASGQAASSGTLLLIEAETGARRLLARGDFFDLEISPDGRSLAAMADGDLIPKDPGALRVVATPGRVRNLALVDLASGRTVTPCLDCNLATHLIAWSPGSREVLVFGARAGSAPQRFMRISAAGAVDIRTPGLTPSLRQTNEGHVIASGTWLGDRPLLLLAPDGSRADWWLAGPNRPEKNLTSALPAAPGPLLARSETSAVLISKDELWRIDAAGARRPATGIEASLPPQGLGLSSRERLNAPPPVGWYRQAGRWRSTAGHDIGGSAGSVVAAAPDMMATTRGDPDHILRLEFISSRGPVRDLMVLNRRLADVDFAKVREIAGKDLDGRPLKHWLLLPARASTVRPPLIVVPYPGVGHAVPPSPIGSPGRFPTNAELMAAAGYAVLIPSLPSRPHSQPGQGLAEQILAAADLAVATGEVDPRRLAIWGHSFGGYAALMTAARSSRLSAVVALSAPSDLASMRGAFDPQSEALQEIAPSAFNIGWSELGQGGLRASPWDDPAAYVRNSPAFQAGAINAPVLLIHGDTDFVRLSQAQEMFTALERQNKDATLLTFFGEGHIIASPANLRELYARAFAWLDRALALPREASASASAAPQLSSRRAARMSPVQ